VHETRHKQNVKPHGRIEIDRDDVQYVSYVDFPKAGIPSLIVLKKEQQKFERIGLG